MHFEYKIQRIVAGVLALAVFGYLVWLFIDIVSGPAEDEEDIAFSGMLLLEQYQCRRSETSHLIVRGVEDNYRLGNTETARVERSGLNQPLHIGTRDFDEPGQDMDLFDHFELPHDTASGLFVIRMVPPSQTQNDNLIIGRFTLNYETQRRGHGLFFGQNPSHIEQLPGWSRRSDIYWAELGNIEMQSGESLLDIIQDENFGGVIDLMVGDDTIVDFAGIAYCAKPPDSNGLTLWVRSIRPNLTEMPPSVDAGDEFYFTALCLNDPDTYDRRCDPFVGDVPCEIALPMVCYRPGEHAYPGGEVWVHPDMGVDARYWSNQQSARFWSGGNLALTLPVAGDQFDSIEDANNYCRSEFGEEWRTADFHIAAPGYRFSGVGRTEYVGRAWVDIRDQPYATCWDRQ